MTERIREGKPSDLEAIREIERSAGRIFADYGMPEIAAAEPPSTKVLAEYCEHGRLWIVADEVDNPVAYVIVDVVDGCAHIEQISVHADHAGQGLGRSLIAQLMVWAKARKLPALTLTTFSEIPWNAPYYARLGFAVVPEASYSPGLRRIRQHEQTQGLDRWPRVCMRLDL